MAVHCEIVTLGKGSAVRSTDFFFRVIASSRTGQPAARRVLPLSVTFDHRVVTGGEAARFLVAPKADLERAG